MGYLTHQVADAVAVFRRAAIHAPAQAGIFAGQNPSAYNAGDPVRLWVIQVVVIIGITQVLSLFLSRIRQPRVIAEVIGGILLGPSVMGHIPNFTNTVFPSQSIPLLTLTANIGLVLFLFIVGLEVDFRIINRNAKAAMAISAVGLIIPLGLGAALGVPIYHVFTDGDVNFGYFLLFVAVAIGITAFPVLCRILTELKLLDTTVGTVTLAAGVGNDVVGWILLALTVALVNSGNGITALWVLLAAVGYVLFLTIPVRLAFRWLARRTGALETGQPTRMLMTIIIILVFISAFYTDIIGIHAIFGGFLAGLIIPKDNGFAISVVEKLEDLVSILFIPLYFASTGLNTNLGLLNNGITWAYVVLICVIAFFSKFVGCAIVAKISGFNYRESGAIGALMSCKGLVELIVLNVGLTAGILDTRTFSMFVLHALVLTFMTTPLTILLYPAKYRKHVNSALDKEQAPATSSGDPSQRMSLEQTVKNRFLVVLDKVEQLPSIMTLTQLFQYPLGASSSVSLSDASIHKDNASLTSVETSPVLPKVPDSRTRPHHPSVTALRLIELTDRTSAVLKSQQADLLVQSDHVLNVFRTFGYLNRLPVSCALSVVGHEEFPSSVAKHASQASAQLVIVPWSGCSAASDDDTASLSTTEALFPQLQRSPVIAHSQYIRKVFADAPADVALFVDQTTPPPYTDQSTQHIFMPFFGGPDDRLALAFVAQLCMRRSVTATIIRVHKSSIHELTTVNTLNTIDEVKAQNVQSGFASVHHPYLHDTVYDFKDTQALAASEEADDQMWAEYMSPPVGSNSAFSRLTLQDQESTRPLHTVLSAVTDAIARSRQSHSRLLVVTGRSRSMQHDALHNELLELCTERGTSLTTDVQKTLGDVAAAFVAANSNVSLLVMQACSRR